MGCNYWIGLFLFFFIFRGLYGFLGDCRCFRIVPSSTSTYLMRVSNVVCSIMVCGKAMCTRPDLVAKTDTVVIL